MSARPNADGPVASSQELLQSALRRSNQRNAHVAKRRLWLRWSLWGLGQAARYLSLPVLLVLGALTWADHWPSNPPTTPPLPSAKREVPRTPGPAPSNVASTDVYNTTREDLAAPSLQLRLDADPPVKRRGPQAQSRKPVAQDKDPTPTTRQETP